MSETIDTFGFVTAIKQEPQQLRRRMGIIVSVETGYTITIQLAGDTTSFSGIKYFGHYPPKVGAQVWLDTDGADIVAIGAIAGLGGAVPAGLTIKAANQSIATASNTTITWPAPATDTFGIWDAANNRWVVPFDGMWLINTTLIWAANATGARAAYIMQGANIISISRGQATSGVTTIMNCSTIAKATKNDNFSIQGYQSSGGALNVETNANICNFSISYLGPAA